MKVFIGITLFLFLLLAESFFAGSEIALIAADRAYLKKKSLSSLGARIALRLIENPEWFLTTTLLGLNLSVIGNGVFTTAFLISTLPSYGGLIASLVLPPLMLFFGQIVPKNFSQQRANQLAPKVAPLIFLFSRLLYPIIWLVSHLIALFTSNDKGKKLPAISREEISLMVNSEEVLDPTERRLLRRLLDFSKKTAAQVMIPLLRVKAIEESSTVEQVFKTFVKTGFSKLLVFREVPTQIVGMIWAKDFLDMEPTPAPIRPLVREVYYVPEFKPAAELLAEMQREGKTLCVVVNEYGQASGIVTIEDLVEEILGEFWDEFDQKLVPYIKLASNHFLVKAWLEIERVKDELGIEIPLGDYETIGGFLLKLAGRIPQKGEIFKYKNLLFQIRRANKMSIDEIEIWIKKQTKNKNPS